MPLKINGLFHEKKCIFGVIKATIRHHGVILGLLISKLFCNMIKHAKVIQPLYIMTQSFSVLQAFTCCGGLIAAKHFFSFELGYANILALTLGLPRLVD